MLNNEELELLEKVQSRLGKTDPKDLELIEQVRELINKYKKVRTKLSSKIVIMEQALRQERLKGKSIPQIAKHFKCSPSTIWRLIVLYRLQGVGGKQEFNTKGKGLENES